ncbi:MAG: TetR family transcriptional regulator C-terminal domain-containing protein, partial [Myxococcales bacterium]|nr:TetR family transcriptional regulator C-terminal domain-containing protein [Myxococcales bacterium]
QSKTLEAWGRGDDPFASLRSSLEALWAARAERTDEALVVADLLAQSLYEDKLRPRLAEFYRLAVGQMFEHLAPHLESLGIEPRIPMKLLPRMVIGLLDGLVMQHFVEPGVLDPSEVVDAVQTLAIALFTPPNPGSS